MGNPVVIIRADGSVAIGMGHLMRCGALADELIKRGWSCVFLCRNSDGQATEYFAKNSYAFRMMPRNVTLADDLSYTVKFAREIGAKLLVTDSYQFDEWYLKQMRCSGLLTLNIDDCGKVKQSSNLVLNQNPSAVQMKYDSDGNTKFLLGASYALIRKDLCDASRKIRPIAAKAHHILVTMGGGADDDNVTGLILDALKDTTDVTGDIIVTPSYTHFQAVERLCRSSYGRFVCHAGSDKMGDLMVAADIMFSAAGITSLERGFLGVPGFLVILSGNQEPNASYLDAYGAAISLGWPSGLIRETIINKFEILASDISERTRMRAKGRELIDGAGSSRVADEIEKIVRHV